MPKILSTVIFWIRDQNVLKDYLYGLAKDKTNYLRSDDFGLTWKSVSEYEFKTVQLNLI